MPSLAGAVLFIEDDFESKAPHFDRDLQSLIHLPDFSGVEAIVIGRFQKASEIPEASIRKIVSSKKELAGIPVIANADFGHTTPQFTFPIGGQATIRAIGSEVHLIIEEH